MFLCLARPRVLFAQQHVVPLEEIEPTLKVQGTAKLCWEAAGPGPGEGMERETGPAPRRAGGGGGVGGTGLFWVMGTASSRRAQALRGWEGGISKVASQPGPAMGSGL